MAERLKVEQAVAIKGFFPGQCLHRPSRVQFPRPVINISCGSHHNLAVNNQGKTYRWGLGQSNELSQGKEDDGKEIELSYTPKILTSKGSERGLLKSIRCVAGVTHSLLIAAAIPPTAENKGTF
ncbi:hypothetical protein PtB15_10B157 [Puccinia triticina]|nr:hypothetical protein PtB15_10B157 [Puccinia triticina]